MCKGGLLVESQLHVVEGECRRLGGLIPVPIPRSSATLCQLDAPSAMPVQKGGRPPTHAIKEEQTSRSTYTQTQTHPHPHSYTPTHIYTHLRLLQQQPPQVAVPPTHPPTHTHIHTPTHIYTHLRLLQRQPPQVRAAPPPPNTHTSTPTPTHQHTYTRTCVSSSGRKWPSPPWISARTWSFKKGFSTGGGGRR